MKQGGTPLETFKSDILHTYYRRRVQKFLDTLPLVVVGYFDDVQGVNLQYLLALHLDADLEDYPACDHFQVRIITHSDDNRRLVDILKEFQRCPHIKAWVFGDSISEQEIKVCMPSWTLWTQKWLSAGHDYAVVMNLVDS